MTIWEVESARPIARFDSRQVSMPLSKFVRVCFSPDHRHVAVYAFGHGVVIWDFTGSPRAPIDSKKDLVERNAWKSIGDSDPSVGYKCIWQLVAMGDQAIPTIELELRDTHDRKRCVAHLKELDDDRYQIREKAYAELASNALHIEFLLRETLNDFKSSAEVKRRIKNLLGELEVKHLRVVRTITVLEYINSPGSRALITKLASGDPESYITWVARGAKRRVESSSAQK